MNYYDSIEKSGEYLRMALNFMGRYSIPLDPIHYAVWYEYVSGKNKELKTAIESILEDKKPVTPEICQNLYMQYIEDRNHAILETLRKEIRAGLSDTFSHMLKTESDISHYGQVLESCSGLIVNGMNIQELNNIVDDVLKETKHMEESGKYLQKHIKFSIEQIDAFRTKIIKLREQATTDSLTGLANRKTFNEIIAAQVEQAQKSSTTLCMIIADIDHFKKVNDSFGHLVGDQVLKKAADIIKGLIKGNDFAARYGGEEFVILLPDTPINGALIVAEKLRALFEGGKWKKKGNGKSIGSITISLGVARYMPGETLDHFIQRADRNLYNAKKQGRNRVAYEKNL